MMLSIVRTTIVCRSTSSVGLKSFIRLAGSLQQQHKEQSIKRKDFFLDPNLTKAFEKIKTGDFIPPVVTANTVESSETISSIGTKREQLRQSTLGKLVYVGKLDKPFRAAKSLSLASSIGGGICYPVMLPSILRETNIYMAIGYTIISATFVLLTPSLIQMICKRYLTSLYYHEQTGQFTGFYKNFFMMERQIRFRADDVEVPPITGMFTSMLIQNQPFFINHDDFYDKPILMKMLGYDKEFDFSKYTKDIQTNDENDLKKNNRTK